MPTNTKMESCIADERGALVFWSPELQQRKTGSKVQIIDVFSLQVVTGYIRDPQGRLLLESQPSVAAGRSWGLAKAAQLIRNDARPHRWVALHLNKRAWGLFWAGGGLPHCRALLADRISTEEASSALVPATPEALLRLVLDLQTDATVASGMVWDRTPNGKTASTAGTTTANPWQLVVWTSFAWLGILSLTVAGFVGVVERQDRKLEQLLQRLEPAALQR
jgi:hypothetical protein